MFVEHGASLFFLVMMIYLGLSNIRTGMIYNHIPILLMIGYIVNAVLIGQSVQEIITMLVYGVIAGLVVFVLALVASGGARPPMGIVKVSGSLFMWLAVNEGNLVAFLIISTLLLGGFAVLFVMIDKFFRANKPSSSIHLGAILAFAALITYAPVTDLVKVTFQTIV